jgi:predicted DNA binding protein/GAF domain-containing protein
MNSTVVLVDDDLQHTLVAGDLLGRIGCPLDGTCGTGLEEAFPPEAARTLREHYRSAFEGETDTTRLTCWDRELRVQTTPVRDERGEITAAMGLFLELSDWRWYADAIESLRRRTEELLAADTRAELFRALVDAVTAHFQFAGATVYRFDEETATLRPEATAGDGLDAEPISPGNHPVWETFRRGEAVFRGDLCADPEPSPDDCDGYHFAVPFGEECVLAVADGDELAGRESIAEPIRILCVTAEPLLDRIRSDERLRECDRELQRRTRQRERAERVTETLRAVIEAAVSADTLEELDTGVCDRIVENDLIDFAWIGSLDRASMTVRPLASAGDERGYLERMPIDLDGSDEPTATAVLDREVTAIGDVAAEFDEGKWRARALERGFRSIIAIPLLHEGMLYGVLALYADDPDVFDGLASAAADLGRIVGYASTAIQCQTALLTGEPTELDIEITATACFFVRFVRETQTSVSFESISSTGEGLSCVDVIADDPELLVEYARNSIVIDSVGSFDDASDTIEVRFDDSFIGAYLSTHGITLERASATPEQVRITVSIPPTMTPRDALEVVRTEYPDSSLLAKRDVRDATAPEPTRSSFFERLTERQREVVERAYREGYFECPKQTTGKALAETMDISASAFHNHLRAAESELFSWLFDHREA